MGLNKQGLNKIDWTDYTWNPISGCLHGCEYCYMLRMEKQFNGIMKPKYHPTRIYDIVRLKKPSKIFTGSSGDMWGEWVPENWINSVLNTVKCYPQHSFQFLTKNPKRYIGFPQYQHCWFGTTIDGTEKTKDNLHDLIMATNTKKRFISFEPLLKLPDFKYKIHDISWIIIGANSNKGEKKPPKEWADLIIQEAKDLNIPVWIKDNYDYPERIKEFPDSIKTLSEEKEAE